MVKGIVGTVGLVIFQLMGNIYGVLPRRLQGFLGNLLGSLLHALKFRAKVIRQNLSFAFPGDIDTQNRIFRASYQHLGNLILEILMVFGSMQKFVLKYVDLTGKEHVQAAQKRGKGLIFLSSHVGNWEVMAGAGGLIAEADLMLVTKHLKPEWIHQGILRGRLKCKVRGTYEPRTMRDVLGHLKRNGAVGIVLDQYTGPPVGVRVPLFNTYVGTSLVLAILAKRTGTTVLPVENFRKPDGRWTVAIGAPLKWEEHSDANFELAANTAAYVRIIEKSVLAHPEQWLWTHRRYKGDLTPLRTGEWNEGRARK
ncbi:MAG: lysophospholipid acyltransferase family protein [Bdellovibrionia bacterium]